MYFLKLATVEDTETVLGLIEELFNESIYSKSMSFDRDSVKEIFLQVLNGPKDKSSIILLRSEDKTVGLLACSVLQQLFNKNERTACELVFWVQPECRNIITLKKLLQAYRFWAKKVGCTSIMYGKMKSKYEVETYVLRKL